MRHSSHMEPSMTTTTAPQPTRDVWVLEVHYGPATEQALPAHH